MPDKRKIFQISDLFKTFLNLYYFEGKKGSGKKKRDTTMKFKKRNLKGNIFVHEATLDNCESASSLSEIELGMLNHTFTIVIFGNISLNIENRTSYSHMNENCPQFFILINS